MERKIYLHVMPIRTIPHHEIQRCLGQELLLKIFHSNATRYTILILPVLVFTKNFMSFSSVIVINPSMSEWKQLHVTWVSLLRFITYYKEAVVQQQREVQTSITEFCLAMFFEGSKLHACRWKPHNRVAFKRGYKNAWTW